MIGESRARVRGWPVAVSVGAAATVALVTAPAALACKGAACPEHGAGGLTPECVGGCGGKQISSPLCDERLLGQTNGGLDVPADQTYCLTGATVNGPVRVGAGASLFSEDASALDGPLSADGAYELVLCDTTFNGPTRLQGTSGGVLLSNGSSGCPGDAFNGPLALLGNSADPVQLVDAQVSGAVLVSDNTDPDGSVVADNAIGGPLWCAGNSTAPTDGGFANQVAGPELGQCAGL